MLCRRALATTVDHLDNDTENNYPHNYQSLCDKCHSWKTANIDYGNVGSMCMTVQSRGDYQRMLVGLRMAEAIDYDISDLPSMQLHIVRLMYESQHET